MANSIKKTVCPKCGNKEASLIVSQVICKCGYNGPKTTKK